MKQARQLFGKGGFELYSVILAFSLIQKYIFLPAISFIWKITLMTTPDGYISNTNIGHTLVKSPWIVLIGAAILAVVLIFSMWQVSATVLGVAYVREGKRVRARDLLRISARYSIRLKNPKNWLLLVYTVIILPLTNIFQASEMIGTFVVPEYIQDFIDSKISLRILYGAIVIAALFFALRWLFVLPSYYLKRRDFGDASKESFALTKKENIKNGIKLGFYGTIESIRLVFLPFLTMFIVCGLGLYFVKDYPYAIELFPIIVINNAWDVVMSVCGVMVYLSSMCFVISMYYNNCEANGTLEEIHLPILAREAKFHVPGFIVRLAASIGATVLFLSFYLFMVWAVQVAPSVADIIFTRPQIVAHKGYSSQAPENTMDAFELADQSGNVDFIELDVWSSKDGIPVVVHNETITAATGKKGYVYDYTYEELSQIPAPYSMDLEKFPNARIPSLEEVLAAYADTTPILIEIKGYQADSLLPSKIVDLMKKYNCTETSMIHSGDYGALKAVKLCCPNIQCGYIQAMVTGNCYDLPYADFVSVEHSFVTSNMISELHQRGKKVYVWTVNEKSSMKAMRSVYVDGIITDYPDDVVTVLEGNIGIFDGIINSVLNSTRVGEGYEAGEY